MKVLFNSSLVAGNNCQYQKRQACEPHNNYKYNSISATMGTGVVAFRAKPDSTMLLSQSDKLLCAYSRKPMLSPYLFRTIVAKLAKKTNAQSAINFLREYRDYMPDVEASIFDMFEHEGMSGKNDFQDILIKNRSEALVRLRQKQTDVLHSTDEYILKQGNDFADEMFYLRDNALLKVNDGTFRRSDVLENLNTVSKELPAYKRNFRDLYKMWYKLPRSLTDYDAFIVKYSKFSHNEIAQRLLSMAVASVEHIKPYASGGQDILWNYVLTQTLYNKDRCDMPLTEYDELNPEIGVKQNLCKYINDICNEIQKGNKFLEANYLYPKYLGQNIAVETGWSSFFDIAQDDMRNLKKSPKLTGSKKGSNRYRTNHK